MSDIVKWEGNIWESISYINLCSICGVKDTCNVYVERKKVHICENFKECSHSSKLAEQFNGNE